MARNKKGRESNFQGIFYEDLDPKNATSPYHAWYYTPKIGKDGRKISRPVHAWFKSKRKRDDWARETDAIRTDMGLKSKALDKERLKHWERADAMLDPWENPIDVVQQWRSTHPRLGARPEKKTGGPTANQVIDAFYLRHNEDPKFVANQFDSHMVRFREQFGSKSVQWLCKNKHEIANWIKDLDMAPYTKRNQKARVAVAFSEALQDGLILENPFYQLKVKTGKRPKKIEYLSIEDCIKLFCANFDRPGTCARLALGMIGGLRSSAVPRVEYCDFRFSIDALHIPDWKSKTGKEDLIEEWPAVVWEWVRYANPSDFAPPCEDIEDEAKVFEWKKKLGTKWMHEKEDALKRADLLVTREDKIFTSGEAELKGPPKNWARHSFGTYHANAFYDLALTSSLMSHEVSVAMLKTHYKGVTTKAHSKRFFELTPDFIRSLLEKKS